MLFQLLPGERIIVGLRKHWFIFAMETAGLFVAGAIPLILSPWADVVLSPLFPTFSSSQMANVILFFLAGWLLLLLFVFFVLLTTYYLDIIVITNERIIDIEQISLFSRDIAVTSLHNVEDVKVEVLGIFATFFDFGNLSIQTAAETREFLVKGVRHPEYARNIIMQAYEEAIRRKNPKP
jgi:hypothetical protein